jgi:hypothetical protein
LDESGSFDWRNLFKINEITQLGFASRIFDRISLEPAYLWLVIEQNSPKSEESRLKF